MKRLTLKTVRVVPDHEAEVYLGELIAAGYPPEVMHQVSETGIGIWDEPEKKVKTIITLNDASNEGQQ